VLSASLIELGVPGRDDASRSCPRRMSGELGSLDGGNIALCAGGDETNDDDGGQTIGDESKSRVPNGDKERRGDERGTIRANGEDVSGQMTSGIGEGEGDEKAEKVRCDI
jgi:hypothetical protein